MNWWVMSFITGINFDNFKHLQKICWATFWKAAVVTESGKMLTLSLFKSKQKGSISAGLHVPENACYLIENETVWPKFVQTKLWKPKYTGNSFNVCIPIRMSPQLQRISGWSVILKYNICEHFPYSPFKHCSE